jgi:hypothetical protein
MKQLLDPAAEPVLDDPLGRLEPGRVAAGRLLLPAFPGDWPVDEWWDDEGEGEGGNSPPGSASRGPIGTCASRLTGKVGEFILEGMRLEADGLSYPPP